MADFTTLGAHFAVRVNDGFKWAMYHMTAPSEADAHAAARTMWASDTNKVRIQDQPMPDAVTPEMEPEKVDEFAEMKADLAAATEEIDRRQQVIDESKTAIASRDEEIAGLKARLNEPTTAGPVAAPLDGTTQSPISTGGPVITNPGETTSGYVG